MSSLIIPPGKKTGCLVRKSKPGEWSPMAADKIDIIPHQEWTPWIDKVDLRPFGGVPNDQNGVGSCATESTEKAVEIAEVMAGMERVPLNPWFLYYHSSGGVDRGSSIDENLRLAREIGIAPRSVWDRDKGWRTRPSAEAYDAALRHRIEEFYDVTSVDEIGSCLIAGLPVVFGWEGHSVVFTSLKSLVEAEYLNSWGAWGDQGYGRLDMRRVNWAYGAYAVRVAGQAI